MEARLKTGKGETHPNFFFSFFFFAHHVDITIEMNTARCDERVQTPPHLSGACESWQLDRNVNILNCGVIQCIYLFIFHGESSSFSAMHVQMLWQKKPEILLSIVAICLWYGFQICKQSHKALRFFLFFFCGSTYDLKVQQIAKWNWLQDNKIRGCLWVRVWKHVLELSSWLTFRVHVMLLSETGGGGFKIK